MKKAVLFSGFSFFAVAFNILSAQEANPTPAVDSSPNPKFSVGALVDTYYSYKFQQVSRKDLGPTDGNVGYFNPTIFNATLALAEISFTARQGEAAFHISTIYGETADKMPNIDPVVTFGGPPPTGLLGIWEVYASYSPGDWAFKFGKLAAHMGNEVIESNKDWNYTRSLLFSSMLMPHYHVGLSANYTTPDKVFGATGYIYNGIDNDGLVVAPGEEKTYGLKLSVQPAPNFNLVFNGLTGPDPHTNNDVFGQSIMEIILNWKVTPELSFALDAALNYQYPQSSLTAASNTYWGSALYGRYQIAKDWAVAFRLEETDNSSPADTLFGSFVLPATNLEYREATLTFEHNFSAHFLARLEGRYDYALSGGNPYPVGIGPYTDGANDQGTATASVVVSF